MIQSLDDTLFQLLASGLTTLGGPQAAKAGQIRFQPPDRSWRQHISQLAGLNGLNVYLVDVRENRRLRSNEIVRDYDPAGVFFTDSRAPTRADCHYLITAWSNTDESLADPANGVHGGTGEEHMILHDVASLLDGHDPLVPADIFGGAFPPGFDADLADTSLPTVLLPVDGFPKYAEFWGTMGQVHPWKPAVYLVVTIPLRVARPTQGPLVHTELVGYGLDSGPIVETRLTIGVEVLHLVHNPPIPDVLVPVANALVALERGGRRFGVGVCDDEGRAVLDDVPAGTYDLHAWATGLGDTTTHNVAVPSGGGDYRVTF